jgi:hypothetical protein
MDNADDVARDDSDDELEFTDDEDSFVMMTPAITMSQKIAAESVASKVCFTRSMLLGTECATYPRIASFGPPLTAKAAA